METLGIILIILGIASIIVEMIMPGFGLFGILGILSLAAGIIIRVAVADSWVEGVIIFAIAALILLVAFVVIMRSASSGVISRSRFILRDELNKQAGFSSSKDQQELLGQTGTALTVLRPAGTAKIGGRKIDVVTDGEFISGGETVKVIQVEGLKVLVEHFRPETVE